MGPLGHAGISGALAGAVWIVSHNGEAAGATLAAGTLIDVDHCVDYLRAEGPRFRLSSVRSGSYFQSNGYALVLLHSYEIVALVAVVLGLAGKPGLAVGLLIGSLSHIVTDVIFYRFTPMCYSLVYRWRHGFKLSCFRRHARIQEEVTVSP